MPSSMNLLFSINQKFTGLLCNCLKSVFRNGGADFYEIYILHSDLNQTAMEHIRSSVGENGSCHFICLDEEMFRDFPESERYPRQIYYRLIAPMVLPDTLDRILYLDVDLVVINPLNDLYGMDFEGNYYIACSHTNELLTKINQLRLGTGDGVPYINTGVLLMNLALLRDKVSLNCLRDVTSQCYRKLILPDQDLLVKLHGDKVKQVDAMKYNLSDRMLLAHNANLSNEYLDLDWVRAHTVIIHYCGKNKPWNESYHGILDVFYHENL